MNQGLFDSVINKMGSDESLPQSEFNDKQYEKKQEKTKLAAEATEAHRHECEVRWMVCRYRDKGADTVKAYLAKCKTSRGTAATERLRQDAWKIINDENKTKI